MPATDVIFYREVDGAVPVLEWLQELKSRDSRAAEKCVAQIGILRRFGHELRRPTADYLRDGVYELRVRVGRSQHRMLYFFHGRNIVVIAHALTKEKSVPRRDIERAISRMESFRRRPDAHSHRIELSNG